MKCTKPHCDCVEVEERRTGGPVKSYPCLAAAGKKNSLAELKSIEERVKAFCQTDVMRAQSAELLPLDFIVWYSGMQPEKILSAYQRYKTESGNSA